MALARGSRLGPYEIVDKLGEGGMGEVWKAHDQRLGREVAIKMSRAAFNERFEREARAVAALNHPNICTLYDVGPDYLVMEHIDGQPLRGPLPLDQALPIAIDIAGALDAAHRKGIIHRDLKPGNILMTKAGVKLLDFGLAKLTHAKPSDVERTVTQAISQEGAIVGTLQYMAPEQLQGHEADARSDIFSFGCVLYELLSGHRAFNGKDHASVIASILKDPPPPIPSGSVLPKSLDRVMRKCLAKDPDRRWQTASDLRDELQWIAAGGEADGAPVAEHRPWRIIAPWSIAAICAMLAVAAYYMGRQRGEPADTRVVRFPLLLPDDATRFYDVSPTGDRVLFYRRQGGYWIFSLDSGKIAPVNNAPKNVNAYWLLDGQGLLFRSGTSVQKHDLNSGVTTSIAESSDQLAGWAPGGILTSKMGLRFIPFDREPRQLTNIEGSETGAFGQSLPDGKHFLAFGFQNGGGARSLRFGAFAGGPLKFVARFDNLPFYVKPGYLLYLKGETLVAQAFDQSSGTLSGSPQSLVEKVGRSDTNGAFGDFSVSQNGILAYRHGSRYKDMSLVWYDRTGKVLGKVGETADYSNPALSPDEKRLAVGIRDPQTDTRDIWIFDLERGGKTRLTFDEGDDFNPVWSPDGSRIAYTSKRKGNRDLYIKNANGSGDEQPLLISNVDKSAESWSPDGQYLSMVLQSPGNSDIYLLPMDGSGKSLVPFRTTRFGEQSSNFSPDSRLIAYRTNENGRFEVYVQPRDAKGGRWQISTAGGDDPSWRADGKELYYVAEDDKVMAVDIAQSGDGIRAGVPKPLFATSRILSRRNRYVVSRDGQRFLAINVESSAKPEPPIVVLNWPALLKNK